MAVFSQPATTSAQGGHPLAVISYRYWQRRFARDPGVIGRKVIVNGYPRTIIRVSQAGYFGTDPGQATEVRAPITMSKQLARYLDLNKRRSRWGNRVWSA